MGDGHEFDREYYQRHGARACGHPAPATQPESDINPIEQWARDEYREGVSAGAAARQICRTLGCAGTAPTLLRMLEDMLSEANRDSFDRHMILEAFRKADPEAAATAKRESFLRNNPHIAA